MADLGDLTDFTGVRLPAGETEMSRRYLRLLEQWTPLIMRYFSDWPVRPNCGHLLGGVYWYGQETAMSIVALAAAGGRVVEPLEPMVVDRTAARG